MLNSLSMENHFSRRGRVPMDGSRQGKLSMIQVSFLNESPMLRDATQFQIGKLKMPFSYAGVLCTVLDGLGWTTSRSRQIYAVVCEYRICDLGDDGLQTVQLGA